MLFFNLQNVIADFRMKPDKPPLTWCIIVVLGNLMFPDLFEKVFFINISFY